MELSRRSAAAAGLFGERVLAQDRLARTLGFAGSRAAPAPQALARVARALGRTRPA
jgi:hypothetical protein